MNINRLILAAETLAWLANQAATPGEEEEKRIGMAAALTLANFYLVEYTANLLKGAEPYDALVLTIQGEGGLTAAHRGSAHAALMYATHNSALRSDTVQIEKNRS